ncbi:MAG: hypothetical protein JSU00_13625 [Acidobacteria bacterium]|nr:hypothetical protein [Acidobacteriota bacterium]
MRRLGDEFVFAPAAGVHGNPVAAAAHLDVIPLRPNPHRFASIHRNSRISIGRSSRSPSGSKWLR